MLSATTLPRVLAALVAFVLTASLLVVTSPVAIGGEDITASWTTGPTFPSGFTDRWDAAVAYHPPSNKVVLFGGAPTRAGEPWMRDVWTTNGTQNWTQGPAVPSALSRRGGSAMAYFPPTGDLVLFSGGGDEWPYPNDTWLFNGSSWRQGPQAPAAMQGRIGAEMAYDPNIGKLVLHGGAGVEPFTDTWLFDGTGWESGPTPHPDMEPRAYFGMTYDARLDKIVMAGGSGGRHAFYFNGTRWVNAPDLPAAVGAVERMDLEFHPGVDAALFFGGIGPRISSDRLWAFQRGGVWDEAAQTGVIKPGQRFDAELVWVDHIDTMLMIGGVHHRKNGEDVYRETFKLQVEIN